MKKEKEKRKKEIDERKKLKLEAEKKSPYNQIAELYEVPLEPDFWPLNGIRWQSKNVALECLQKLLQLARLSEFSEKHFNMPSEKENSNSSNSKKEKKRKKKLIEDAKTLSTSLLDIEKALYQTKNRSNQDPLNFPIRLTNKLGYLNRLVTNNDFPPTDQDEAVRKEMTTLVEGHLAEYNKLISGDLELFNEAFAKLNLDYLTLN